MSSVKSVKKKGKILANPFKGFTDTSDSQPI